MVSKNSAAQWGIVFALLSPGCGENIPSEREVPREEGESISEGTPEGMILFDKAERLIDTFERSALAVVEDPRSVRISFLDDWADFRVQVPDTAYVGCREIGVYPSGYGQDTGYCQYYRSLDKVVGNLDLEFSRRRIRGLVKYDSKYVLWDNTGHPTCGLTELHEPTASDFSHIEMEPCLDLHAGAQGVIRRLTEIGMSKEISDCFEWYNDPAYEEQRAREIDCP